MFCLEYKSVIKNILLQSIVFKTISRSKKAITEYMIKIIVYLILNNIVDLNVFKMINYFFLNTNIMWCSTSIFKLSFNNIFS